jgi:hypothetical protein
MPFQVIVGVALVSHLSQRLPKLTFLVPLHERLSLFFIAWYAEIRQHEKMYATDLG